MKIIKLLNGFCALALLFGFDKHMVLAFTSTLPSSLLKERGSNGNDSDFMIHFVKPGDRVVGGKPAYHGEFPYQVSIQKIGFFGSKTHYCGGAIISEYCIVTAAHCLDGRSLDSIVVRVGSNSLRNDPLAKEYEISETILHSGYDTSTIQSDIGIVKLKKKLEFKLNVNKIKLTEFKNKVPVDTRCIVSGWGSTREGTPTIKTLMYADVPVMDDATCRETYGKSQIFDSMLCAGYREGGTDSCQGDSGGPLVCDGRLAGVVSWGIGCARAKYPGVYTELSYFTEWVDAQDCSKATPPPTGTSTIGSFFANIFGLTRSQNNETQKLPNFHRVQHNSSESIFSNY